MQITWSPNFTAAVGRAVVENKPIMAVLAAGELDGLC
jgi:hypothetical protein